jgi:HD-like signal output (HDOD) protein
MDDLATLRTALLLRLDSNSIAIPPYPAVAVRLEELSRQPRTSIRALAAVVAAEPLLAASVVGLAQSASHALGHVATLEDAIRRIGMAQLVELALTHALGRAAVTPGPLAALRRDTWRRALLGAYLARMLAGNRGIPCDVAYLAGLFHELGAVVATGALEGLASQYQLPALPLPAWHAFVRDLEGPFGRAIAARWNLPPALVAVVTHEPSATALGELVALVAQIVGRLDNAPTSGIAMLVALPALSDIERASIGSVVQEVVRTMALYSVPGAVPASPVIATAPEPESFAVSFEITPQKHPRARARRISSSMLAFEGKQPIAPNWLVELTVHCAEPFSMLANVQRCDEQPGSYAIEVKPFALEGDAQEKWVQLLIDARMAAP